MDLVLQELVDSGLVTAEQVTECAGQVARLAAQGASPLPTVRELLEQKGYLSPSSHPTKAVTAGGSAPARAGRFERRRLLGRGGMGSVYLGFDTQLQREVALKFLTSTENPEDVERFLREAQVAAKLRHPNIAPVYDVGTEGAAHYIAMEYVDGTTIDRAKLTLRRTLELFVEIAAAVHYANGEGIVHRDLKPSNLMVDRRGRVFVMDFGLARSTAADSRLSVSGMVIGTPSFMPPEQAEGRKDIDARADVWALGATLYALATGRPPFQGEGPIDTALRVVRDDVVPPRKIHPTLAPDVETILLKALEKDRARRYATAEAFGADIRRYLDGEAIEARPASVAYRLRIKLAKHKAVVVSALAALVATAAIGGWFAVKSREHASGKQAAEKALDLAGAFWSMELRARDVIAWAEDLGHVSPPEEIARRRKELELAIAAVDAEHPGNRVAKAYRAWFRCLTGEEAEGLREFDDVPAPFAAAWRGRYWLTRCFRASPPPAMDLDPGATATVLEYDAGSGRPHLEKARVEFASVADAAAWSVLKEGRRMGELCRAAILVADGKQHEAILALDDLSLDAACKREATRLAGMARLLKGDTAGAAKTWREAAGERPSSYVLWQLCAGAELGSAVGAPEPAEGLKRAIEAATRAAELGPTQGEPLAIRAMARRQLSERMRERGENGTAELRAAVDDFRKAARLRPGVAVILTGSANAMVSLAEVEPERKGELLQAALALATQALEGTTGRDIAFNIRGEVRRKMALALQRTGQEDRGELRAAVEDYTRSIELKDRPLSRASRGWCRDELGDPGGAMEDLDRALEMEPRHTVALLYRASIRSSRATRLAAKGQDPRPEIRLGIVDLDTLLSARPRDRQALNNRADLHKGLATAAAARGEEPGDHYRRAIEDATRAIEASPSYVNAYVSRGTARMEWAFHKFARGVDVSAEITAASRDFDAAVAAEPESTVALEGRGTFYMTLVVQLQPRGFDVREYLENGLKDYSAVLAVNPRHRAVMANRATAYLLLGDARSARGEGGKAEYRRALGDYTELLAGSNDATLRVNRAYTRRKIAALEQAEGANVKETILEAIADLEEALKIAPTHPNAMEMMAEAHEELAGVERDPGPALAKALEAAQAYVKAYPKSPRSWRRLGDVLVTAAGREADGRETIEKAVESYSRALLLAPRDVFALSNRGASLARRADLEAKAGGDATAWLRKAEADYRGALAVQPQLPLVWMNLARTLDDLGDRAAATKALQEGARANPGNARLRELAEGRK
jgi:serine/threonine-protein kinase